MIFLCSWIVLGLQSNGKTKLKSQGWRWDHQGEDHKIAPRMSQNTTSTKILKITIDTDINIIKVGITSSCTGEAVSQPEDSGCFRKSDGDPVENLKIQASNAKVMNRNWSSISSERFVIKIDWQFPQIGRRLGKCNRSPTPMENSCRIFNGCWAENVRTGDPWKDLTNHSDELKHFADDVWALQRLLWTSWLCRRSIRHYLWLSSHQSLFFLVHKSSPVWENGGKVTDPVRLYKQGWYLQSGVCTKGIVLLVRLVEKNAQKDHPERQVSKIGLKDLVDWHLFSFLSLDVRDPGNGRRRDGLYCWWFPF